MLIEKRKPKICPKCGGLLKPIGLMDNYKCKNCGRKFRDV